MQYARYLLLRQFAFSELSDHLQPWQQLIADRAPADKKHRTLYDRVSLCMAEIDLTAEKFQRQLNRLIDAAERDPNGVDALKQRCTKAVEYFTGQIATQIVAPLREHIGMLRTNKKMNQYVRLLQLVEECCWRKIERLYAARFLDERLYSGKPLHIRGEPTPAASGSSLTRLDAGAAKELERAHPRIKHPTRRANG
jgi:hypothetical protein